MSPSDTLGQSNLPAQVSGFIFDIGEPKMGFQARAGR